MDGNGFGLTVTVCEVVPEHPFALITVTEELPLAETVIVSVLDPLLQ